MIARKEIIVLNGGGHKGIVKISGAAGKDGFAKVSCSLDFRPNGAKLYLIGDNVAQMALNSTNQEDEVRFSANSEIGCVLRSSAVTMFGGSGSKSEMLKKIDAFNDSQKNARNSAASKNPIRGNADVPSDNIERQGADESDTPSDASADSVQPEEYQEYEEYQENRNSSEKKENKKNYVGVSSKEVNPLGEWTKYDGNNFYYAVKPQIDEMFVCYPSEDTLAATVPNSKWVRVDAEDGYYVVGLLFDEDEPSFICYGVPQVKTNARPTAPAELENMCVWLPISGHEEIMGFWIIYQSAKTGEIIK